MRVSSLTMAVTGLATAALLVACSERSTTAPEGAASVAPRGPSFNVVQSTAAHLTVCATGPAGTYSYTLSTAAGPDGTPVSTATLPLGTSFSLASGQCADVVVLSGQNITADPPTSVTVTQTSGPIATTLSKVWKTQESTQPPCTDPCGVDTQESGPAVSVLMNLFHGSVLDFVDLPVSTSGGCTFTLGYWKNHTTVWPSPFSPNAPFFSSGKTWLYELSTAPKGGDSYLILAHQWIAATLNIASGAGVPANVKAAYDAGTQYFMSGTGSDPKGWADVLDAYNNGLANGGPSHCN